VTPRRWTRPSWPFTGAPSHVTAGGCCGRHPAGDQVVGEQRAPVLSWWQV